MHAPVALHVEDWASMD